MITMKTLADALAEKNADAYVTYDSSANADRRAQAGFLTSDP